MKPISRGWVNKAEEDYRVARREREAKPAAYSAVCFHAQQCVEKYLKAFLQEQDIPFYRTHDLEALMKTRRARTSAAGKGSMRPGCGGNKRTQSKSNSEMSLRRCAISLPTDHERETSPLAYRYKFHKPKSPPPRV